MYLLNFKFHYNTIDVVILLLYYASFLSTVCVNINLILFCLYNYVCSALAYIQAITNFYLHNVMSLITVLSTETSVICNKVI